MAKNIDRLEEDKALVESKMRRLVDLLVEFNKAVRAFGKKGWMMRVWKMHGHVHSLTRLDKEIVSQLDVFRDVYKLATDNESMKRIYNIEASIDKLVAARVLQTGEPEGKVVAVLSTDPVAIASVAVDARVPPAELASELSEFRLEVKAGLINLDKKMQKMLDGKQGDRKEIQKVLAAVNAAAARDAKLLAAVEGGRKDIADLKASVDSGLQRDASFKRRVAQTLEKRSKKDFVRQTKEAQLEQFEVEPDRVEAKPFAKGGEGEVFMGEYQGDPVVLKKMSLVGVTAIKRQKMLNSFKGELAIMVRLRSPRVAHFYGVVTTDPTFLGLVMEFCPGGSLRGALDTKDEITSDRRRVWVSDVALGMAYLYSQGVEHRDLKALNVLLTGDLRCKVTDFGLSKCEDLKTAGTATKGGAGLAGTPAFMAPELLGDNTFNEQSDVYSFAFVMFEIWSGDTPWRGLQAAQIISQVLVKKARPEISFHIPDEMRKLMVRAWAHEPGARPSFKEISAAVRVSTPRGTAPEWGGSTGGSTAQGTTKSMRDWFS